MCFCSIFSGGVCTFELLTCSCIFPAFDRHLVGVEPVLLLLEGPCVLIEALVVHMIGVEPVAPLLEGIM